MTEEKELVINDEVIEQFLEGHDPQKYIVGIEAPYNENKVSLIINDPEKGKYIEEHTYKPFIWLKHQVALQLYGGNKATIRKAMARWGVKITGLETAYPDGRIPDRIEHGYKYIATCTGSYSDLQQFFKQGGVQTYNKERTFFSLTPAEQFLIQTGKRLFKGMDDYDDVHRFQFDLETEGLDGRRHRIFQIGMRDNRGYERIIEVRGDTEKELRESEIAAIKEFFNEINRLVPDVITGYNSENFDWDFIMKRCEYLYISFENIAKTLHPTQKIYRKDSTLKLGQETEYYEQTYMWGYNILDIMHAVRKAQAINSDIKKAGLKYITQFSKVAKDNRVYVDGDVLFDTWGDDRDYWFNNKDGTWGLLDDAKREDIPEDSEVVTGAYIVQRYLLDDLWETEQVDAIYNQATFLLSKLLPTPYMRAATMGTAGTWKLIMAAWSYENGLAIPDYEAKREFTGGLARLLEVGYAKDVVKLDFAALYPKTQLTHGIVPDLDISGVMPFLLTYIVDTRDRFKFLMGDEKKTVGKLKKGLEEKRDSMSPEEIAKMEGDIKKHAKLQSDYDKKQLPLKILANSFFGSFGAPYLFPWGEINAAEETTCRGRQYLRLMVKHFTETHGFRPLVGDTDGFNFAIPDHIDDIKYICTAEHWKTQKHTAGEELTGLDAVLAEFNEKYMIGRMGLDIDDICSSTINFARKNYANDIDGKVKLVGNSIKSKTMPTYIEEFLDNGIRLLLDGKGYEFIEYYYEYVNKIFNYEIPLVKIATKKRVKQSIDDYVNVYCKTKTKAGSYKSRQAHMELAMKHDLKIDLGDTLYYVNIGTVKSHGDIKSVTDKKTGKKTVELKCKLIPTEQIQKNPDLTTDEYNVARYLEAFNKRITKLLVCFSPEIRDQIQIGVEKIKIKGVKAADLKWSLEPRSYFTKEQCAMDSGNPFEPADQDDYITDLMTMEDKEIRFWSSINEVPNNMEEDEWKRVELDWRDRMRKAKIEGLASERTRLDDIFRRFEADEIEQLETKGNLPKSILAIAEINDHNKYGHSFYSIKWGDWLCPLGDIVKYKDIAISRARYYEEHNELFEGVKPDEKYDLWLDQQDVDTSEFFHVERFNPECDNKLCGSEEWNGGCACHDQFGGDKDKLNAYLEEQEGGVEVSQEVEDALAEQDIIPEDLTKAELEEAKKQITTEKTITLQDVEDCDDCDEEEWNF